MTARGAELEFCSFGPPAQSGLFRTCVSASSRNGIGTARSTPGTPWAWDDANARAFLSAAPRPPLQFPSTTRDIASASIGPASSSLSKEMLEQVVDVQLATCSPYDHTAFHYHSTQRRLPSSFLIALSKERLPALLCDLH